MLQKFECHLMIPHPFWLEWRDNLWLGWTWSGLPKAGIGKCQEGGEEGDGEVLHFSMCCIVEGFVRLA